MIYIAPTSGNNQGAFVAGFLGGGNCRLKVTQYTSCTEYIVPHYSIIVLFTLKLVRKF